jgi:hypothetical protein
MPKQDNRQRAFVYLMVACAILATTAVCFRNGARNAGAQGEAGHPVQVASEAAKAAQEQEMVTVPDNDPDMKARFGTSAVEVPGAATGVIFINGRYIAPPYRVVRRGLAIYVNDIRVERLQWPSRYYQRDDPPLPPGIDRDSKLADIQDWMQLKAR